MSNPLLYLFCILFTAESLAINPYFVIGVPLKMIYVDRMRLVTVLFCQGYEHQPNFGRIAVHGCFNLGLSSKSISPVPHSLPDTLTGTSLQPAVKVKSVK
jgi:hypothetical protein